MPFENTARHASEDVFAAGRRVLSSAAEMDQLRNPRIAAELPATTMLNLQPELREGESILGEERGATVYLTPQNIARGSNVRLWLTNQRVILRAAMGPQRPLPLYALASFQAEQISGISILKLEFNDGQTVWLTVENQIQFLEQLREAREHAPVIPEGVSPGATSPALKGIAGAGLIIGAAIAACGAIAICLFLAVFGGLWSIAGTR